MPAKTRPRQRVRPSWRADLTKGRRTSNPSADFLHLPVHMFPKPGCACDDMLIVSYSGTGRKRFNTLALAKGLPLLLRPQQCLPSVWPCKSACQFCHQPMSKRKTLYSTLAELNFRCCRPSFGKNSIRVTGFLGLTCSHWCYSYVQVWRSAPASSADWRAAM